jgi:division protein CdvB (Snf7/Vps24/ESCRT-III family)
MMNIQMIFHEYFGEIEMTNIAPNAAPTTPPTAAETKQIVLKEIGVKWDKFSAQEVSALKGKDDLVTQVMTKYGIEKGQAQRDVNAMLKGRQI